MKEIKFLYCVQAVLLSYLNLILAAIQELDLQSELAFNNYSHISLKFDINVSTKSVLV